MKNPNAPAVKREAEEDWGKYKAILVGASFQWLSAERSMPRYFFTIHGQDRVADDPESTYLPDEAAALSYTEYKIRELRKKSGYNDLALMMFVEDEARQTILALPFFPGC